VAPTSALRALARQSSVYALTMLLSRAMSFVMVPVYTHRLGAGDYGVAELIDTVDLVALVLLSSAVADPFIRHLHDAPDEPARDRVTSTAIVFLAVVGAAVGLLGVVAAAPLAAVLLRSADRASLLRLTLGSVAFQAMLEIPLARFRAEDRPLRFAAWTLLRTALGLALNLTFIALLDLGVRGLALSTLVASAVTATSLCALTLRRTGLAFDPAALRRMLAFGWPLVPGALSLIALQHGRSYVLNAYCSLDDVGRWALGFKFGALLTQVIGNPLRNAWTAQMYAVWEGPHGRERFARALTLFVALFAWAALALSVAAPDVVRLVAPPSFAGAAMVIPAVASAFALREVAEFFRNGLVLGNNPRPVAWIEPALALADLALGVALVSRFGLAGAVAATPAVFALYALALHAAVRRVLPVRYEYARIAALVALALALGVVGYRGLDAPRAANLALRAATVVAYPALAGWAVFRAADERAAVAALWARLRRAVGASQSP
jgi:O-antigen/teichoic acid export membrane protein